MCMGYTSDSYPFIRPYLNIFGVYAERPFIPMVFGPFLVLGLLLSTAITTNGKPSGLRARDVQAQCRGRC